MFSEKSCLVPKSGGQSGEKGRQGLRVQGPMDAQSLPMQAPWAHCAPKALLLSSVLRTGPPRWASWPVCVPGGLSQGSL
jgi:hypothetical protein